MKYIIFGTGVYYQTFKKYINSDDVICFLDNDEKKQGKYFDGKEIRKPSDANYDECDFVLVLIMRYASVYEQLQEIGVPLNKIKTFYDVGELFDVDVSVLHNNELINFSSWKDSGEKSVLLIAHELTRNGVAVVLMHLAMLLKDMGYNVAMAGLIGGGLEEDLKKENIDYISNISMCYRSEKFQSTIADLSFIVVGAVGSADVVKSLAETQVPILWWLHESNDQNFLDFPVPKKNNIFYFAGGSRVVKKFKEFYPDRRIDKLLYFLPDDEVTVTHGSHMKIAVIGALNYRKAQDLFVEAIKKIPSNVKEKASFDLIGTVVEPVIDVEKVVKENPEINYLGEMSQSELKEYFETLDVLVCCSRDDPMPVVVTQAMQYGIACVVSDQVGQSEYIINEENGYVFRSEDVDALSAILSSIIQKKNVIELGEKSKKIYEENFSSEAMKRNMEKIINEIVVNEY